MDTSIWIELLSSKSRFHLSANQLLQVAVCPPVIQEILQGIARDHIHEQIKDSLLNFQCFGNPMNLDSYLLASDIYRTGRQKGITIRSSIDCLIAAIAIQNKLPIWHQDRDFDAIAKFTALKIENLHKV